MRWCLISPSVHILMSLSNLALHRFVTRSHQPRCLLFVGRVRERGAPFDTHFLPCGSSGETEKVIHAVLV